MKIVVWLAVAGAVCFWQSARALSVQSTISVTTRPAARVVPTLKTTVVTPTTKSAVVPLLSSLITRPAEVAASETLTRASYAPAVIVVRRAPTPTGLVLQPYSPTSKSPLRAASVPDSGATLSLLGIGLLATALAKRIYSVRP